MITSLINYHDIIYFTESMSLGMGMTSGVPVLGRLRGRGILTSVKAKLGYIRRTVSKKNKQKQKQKTKTKQKKTTTNKKGYVVRTVSKQRNK